jgi:hypothetical protein
MYQLPMLIMTSRSAALGDEVALRPQRARPYGLSTFPWSSSRLQPARPAPARRPVPVRQAQPPTRQRPEPTLARRRDGHGDQARGQSESASIVCERVIRERMVMGGDS